MMFPFHFQCGNHESLRERREVYFATPEKKDSNPSNPEQTAKLIDLLKKFSAEGKDDSLSKAIHSYLKNDAKFKEDEILQFSTRAHDKLRNLPDMKTKTVEELNALIDALPTTHEQLLDFAVKAGFISANDLLSIVQRGSGYQKDRKNASTENMSDQEILDELNKTRLKMEEYNVERAHKIEQFNKITAPRLPRSAKSAAYAKVLSEIKQLKSDAGDPVVNYWRLRKAYEERTGISYTETELPEMLRSRSAVIDQAKGERMDKEDSHVLRFGRNAPAWMSDSNYEASDSGRILKSFNRQRGNTTITRSIYDNRARAAAVMPPGFFGAVRGPVTDGDIHRSQLIRSRGGVDSISPSGRHIVLPARGATAQIPLDGSSLMPKKGSPHKRNSQEELKEYYADDLLKEIDLFAAAKDLTETDGYKKIQKTILRRKKLWETQPDLRYGDLAWARSQIEALAVAHDQHKIMQANTERLKSRKVLRSVEVSVPKDPNAKIRIIVPHQLMPFRNGQDKEIIYDPKTDTVRKEDLADLADAGVVFQRFMGGYKDGLGREAVRGVVVHFTREGKYQLNGNLVDVSKDGPVEYAGTLEYREPLISRDVDFNKLFGKNGVANRIVIHRNTSKTPLTFDIASLQPGQRLVGLHGITVIKGPNNTVRVQFAETGIFDIMAIEKTGRNAEMKNIVVGPSSLA